MPVIARQPGAIARQRAVFALIVLIVSTAALLPSLLTGVSARPDFYYLSPELPAPGITPLDWQTLDAMLSSPELPETARPGLFGPLVEIAGYRILLPPDDAEKDFSHFLLVPDPGDWLHAPNLDAGGVIEVRVRRAMAARFAENAAVTVRGTLSYGGLEAHPRALWRLAATDMSYHGQTGGK